MNYRFHPEAFAEYEDAARYYLKRQLGLELRFIEQIEHAIAQITDSPDRWARFADDIRRYLVPVFPYALLYSIENGYVLIIAVMHSSREPNYWKHRIVHE